MVSTIKEEEEEKEEKQQEKTETVVKNNNKHENTYKRNYDTIATSSRRNKPIDVDLSSVLMSIPKTKGSKKVKKETETTDTIEIADTTETIPTPLIKEETTVLATTTTTTTTTNSPTPLIREETEVFKEEVKEERPTLKPYKSRFVIRNELEIETRKLNDYEWGKKLNEVMGIDNSSIPSTVKSSLRNRSNSSFIKALELAKEYLNRNNKQIKKDMSFLNMNPEEGFEDEEFIDLENDDSSLDNDTNNRIDLNNISDSDTSDEYEEEDDEEEDEEDGEGEEEGDGEHESGDVEEEELYAPISDEIEEDERIPNTNVNNSSNSIILDSDDDDDDVVISTTTPQTSNTQTTTTTTTTTTALNNTINIDDDDDIVIVGSSNNKTNKSPISKSKTPNSKSSTEKKKKKKKVVELESDDDEDELLKPSFMDEILKRSTPSTYSPKPTTTTTTTNNNNNNNDNNNNNSNNNNNNTLDDDDSEETVKRMVDRGLDDLDGNRVIDYRVKKQITPINNNNNNNGERQGIEDHYTVEGSNRSDEKWYNEIAMRIIQNDGHGDSKMWLLHLKSIEQCPIMVNNNILNGEKLYFKYEPSKLPQSFTAKSEARLPFSCYSVNTGEHYGFMGFLSPILNALILPLMRKNFIRLGGTAVLVGYNQGKIQANATVDVYYSHFGELNEKIERTTPNASDGSDTGNGIVINTQTIEVLQKLLDSLLGGSLQNNTGGTVQAKNDEINPRDLFVKKVLEPTEAPISFKSELKYHQKEGLWWMLNREQKPFFTYNMAVDDYWKTYRTSPGNGIEGIEFYYNSICDKISLRPPKNKHKVSGGLLCDDMGLGKTVMSIALIMANSPRFSKSRYQLEAYAEIKDQLKNRYEQLRKFQKFVEKPRATLIIAPPNLVAQWKSEFKKHLKPEFHKQMEIFEYHGPNRKKKLAGIDLNLMDVVITTHNTFGIDFKKFEEERLNSRGAAVAPPPLLSIHWWRVIIDESQVCKIKTLIFKGLQNLDSVHKWCLTGTPISNQLDDLYPSLHFMNCYPIAQDIKTWRRLVDRPKNMVLLKQVVNPILLRREKHEVIDFKLPPLTTEIVYLKFDEIEAEDYSILFEIAQETLERIKRRGGILKNYATVLALLLRLRQCCDHYHLIRESQHKEADDICQICDDVADDPVKNNCGHIFCFDCMDSSIKNANSIPKCPECGVQLVLDENEDGDYNGNDNHDKKKKKKNKLNKIKDEGNKKSKHELLDIEIQDDEYDVSEQRFQRDIHDRLNQVIERQKANEEKKKLNQKDKLCSTKVKTLLADIQTTLIDNPEHVKDKCIIFSQWTSMLDIIETAFKTNGWIKNEQYVRYDGKCSHQQKDKVIKTFNEDDNARVMLCSLKAGGVGLNLTRANHLFTIDPWWNSSSEVQSWARAHRMGQTKPVYVKRYIMEKSIEIRILELQESKDQLTNALFSDDYDPSKPLKHFKLNVEDIKLLFKSFD